MKNKLIFSNILPIINRLHTRIYVYVWSVAYIYMFHQRRWYRNEFTAEKMYRDKFVVNFETLIFARDQHKRSRNHFPVRIGLETIRYYGETSGSLSRRFVCYIRTYSVSCGGDSFFAFHFFLNSQKKNDDGTHTQRTVATI